MGPKRLLTVGLEAVAVVVVLSLVAGAGLGQPILLSYVETGSMAPTMEPGDGFVAVPAAVAGDVEPGDVVVFRAEEVGGGGLTTHRVVDETPRGYVTKGDANPFTDQDGGEPPVSDAQIVAVAWQVGGQVVVIPELGTAVTGVADAMTEVQRQVAIALGTRALLGTAALPLLLAALSGLLYVLDLVWSSGTDRERQRTVERDDGVSVTLILGAMALVLVVTATAAMAVPAGTQEFGIVSSEFESESPTVIRTGESSSVEYTVPNAGLVPVYVYLEPASEGVSVDASRLHVPGRGRAETTLTFTAPPETGYYRMYVSHHRYLALLPASTTDALYRIHPWLPVLVIDALLALAVFLFGGLLIDGGRVRVRRRDGPGGTGLSRLLSGRSR